MLSEFTESIYKLSINKLVSLVANMTIKVGGN